jgi:histidine kinase/DNA gyrase B/HSP90-like ATPase/GAF domain-containing protein
VSQNRRQRSASREPGASGWTARAGSASAAQAGSCGRAAYLGEPVVVEDIATHPLWAAYKHLALPHGLRACWSSPIFSTKREVLGTFAMYYREARGPRPREREWVEAGTHLAAGPGVSRRAGHGDPARLAVPQVCEARIACGDVEARTPGWLTLLRATLPASIEIETRFDGAPTVRADPSQIHQVLMNLGTKAAHAMGECGGVLRIALEAVTLDADGAAAVASDLREGHYARLSVSDTGCGMDPATLERAFEPFFTTKAPGAGTGLGLSACTGS